MNMCLKILRSNCTRRFWRLLCVFYTAILNPFLLCLLASQRIKLQTFPLPASQLRESLMDQFWPPRCKNNSVPLQEDFPFKLW